MTLDESRIFEALVSPGDSEAEWFVTDYPLSPDYPRVVKLDKIKSGDLAGRSTARNRSFAQEPFAQEPITARMVSVTATALGTAEIDVRTPGGELFAKCLVTVEPAEDPEIIVVRQGGGCRGAGAPGLVTGLAVLALTLAAKRAEATRTDAQRALLRKTPAGTSATKMM
jgi:hypothetical protein